jgi:hypothetical protein
MSRHPASRSASGPIALMAITRSGIHPRLLAALAASASERGAEPSVDALAGARAAAARR